MYHAAREPQITAIDDRYVPDVRVCDRAAVGVVVVDPSAVYGVGGVDVLIIVSCDVQAVTPTVVVQTVISQDIVLRCLYEYAVVVDSVVDPAVRDVDISGGRCQADAIVLIVADGAVRDGYIIAGPDAQLIAVLDSAVVQLAAAAALVVEIVIAGIVSGDV